MIACSTALGLAAAQLVRYGNDRILLRHHEAELPKGSIAAVSVVARTPELVAVTLVPVALGVAAV